MAKKNKTIDLPTSVGTWGISLDGAMALFNWLNNNPYVGAHLEHNGDGEQFRFEIEDHNGREVIEVKDKTGTYSREVAYIDDIKGASDIMLPQIQKARRG